MTVNPTTADQTSDHVVIRLRADLRSWLRGSGGQVFCLVEDPLQRRYYRVGQREWELACRLNGERTLAQILAMPTAEGTGVAWSPDEVVTLCRWLVDQQLAEVVGRGSAAGLAAPRSVRPSQRSRSWSWANPFFTRVPLGNPDSSLGILLPWTRPLFTRAAVAVWGLLCLSGLYQVLSHWERFASASQQVLAPQNWLCLIACWLGLKLLHETSHGLVCKHFGGSVTSAGVTFVLFSPMAFVDVTSSWQFRSKWQRMATSAAGIYSELFVAAIAAWIWSCSDPGVVQQVCHNLVLMSSISTILFNANPLMRFDGYYLLADALEIPNLYSLGQQWVRNVLRRWYLGLRGAPLVLPSGRAGIVQAYGLASAAWRWTVMISLIAMAAHMFAGAGIVLALSALCLWFALPAVRLIVYLYRGSAQEQPQRLRCAVVSLLTIGVLWGVARLPRPGGELAPAIVQYAPLEIVRTRGPGFVEGVFVEAGQQVRPGDRLLTLYHPETDVEIRDVGRSLEQAVVRARVWHQERDLGKYQVEIHNRETLEQRQRDLTERSGDRTPLAPIAGRVIGPHLHTLEGRYLEPGTPILAIGAEESKEIHVSLSQDQLSEFQKKLGECINVRVQGLPSVLTSVRLVKIQPQASTRIWDQALSASEGGPLAVRGAEVTNRETRQEFVQPRFTAILSCPAEVAAGLIAGQLAQVRLESAESIGQYVYRQASTWWDRQLQRAGASG